MTIISNKHRRNLLRILSFGLLCAFFGFVFTLIEKGILGDLDYYPGTGNEYRFSDAVFITTISTIIPVRETNTVFQMLFLSQRYPHSYSVCFLELLKYSFWKKPFKKFLF
jgi:hypothetical protein